MLESETTAARQKIVRVGNWLLPWFTNWSTERIQKEARKAASRVSVHSTIIDDDTEAAVRRPYLVPSRIYIKPTASDSNVAHELTHFFRLSRNDKVMGHAVGTYLRQLQDDREYEEYLSEGKDLEKEMEDEFPRILKDAMKFRILNLTRESQVYKFEFGVKQYMGPIGMILGTLPQI